MNTSDIFITLKELGHAHNKREELREFCSSNIEKILKLLARRIVNSDGGDLVDCLLNGLPDSLTCRRKAKVVDTVLQVMRKESTSLTHCGEVISRICLELSRFPAEDLVRWCNDSIQSIVDDSDVNMIWRDILPECMSALTSHDIIKHCGTDMTSTDYKEQCVHTLCQCRWSERQLVQLAAMYKDMQLPRGDHAQVVNKICSYIIDIPPDTLPPLVHQLLKLCKAYNLETVLSHLSHYFSVRLYSKLEPPPQDSESTTMDIDDIVTHSPAELSRCLSTCLYHISQGSADPELVRKHLKAWPKTQLLRSPFLIDLALAISDKGSDFRSVCLDVIKVAIEQRLLDEVMSKESAWVRSVLPPDVDVASVLKVLTTESANHRQLTVMGLINLAFTFLASSRTRPTAHACWSLGNLVLVRLCKAQPETAPHILGQLADKLAGDCSQKQYSECVYYLCKLSPTSVERCGELGGLLEAARSAPALGAVHPLLNFSTRTRDALVMVCRKGLYSRDSEHRCLALSGFLTVLKHVRLPRASLTSSQSVCSEQYSAHSYLTQLTLDMHATQQGTQVTSRVRNEAMCMEVVSILRRCLVQDAAVRQLLYTKLYDCAREKPVLHESILELLYEHLAKYLPDGGDDNPLLLDKCVQVTATSAVLLEPISNLLYAVAQFLQAVEEENLEDILASQSGETGSAYLRSKLTDILMTLCTSDNFGHIDMDRGLSDLTPESKAKNLTVQQVMSCYEALVAHLVMQWNPNSTDIANNIYKLFKATNQLQDLVKTPPKQKKKKELNDTRDTTKSQKSQKSQKEPNKGKGKISNMVKDRAGPFKPLPCVWDLRFCARIIELLYSEEVSWSSMEQRNQLRGRRDFHHWALRCVQSSLASDSADKRSIFIYVVKIVTLLYERCICRFRDMCDFDDKTALGCLEIFRAGLGLLFSPNYSFKMESFLPKVVGVQDTTAPACIAHMLQQLHTALVQIDAETAEEQDVTSVKLTAALIQTAVMLLEIPVGPNEEITTVIIKLEEYIRGSRQECLPLLGALLHAAAGQLPEAALLQALLLKLTAALARIDEEDSSVCEDTEEFPWVDGGSAHAALAAACAHLAERARRVARLLARAHDLARARDTAAHAHAHRIDAELKELYKSLVVHLCQLCTWTCSIGKLRCSVGAGSDRVLAAFVRLYGLLATLVKQIHPATATAVRFERLLKLSGKKLSSVTDNLITYLEASQQQQTASKVLRDTKLIPRLVLEAEQYTKNVILLADKAKVNWNQYLSMGTARDFRIKAPVLQEVLNARDNEEQAREGGDDLDITDERSANEEEQSSDEETTSQKRRRVS